MRTNESLVGGRPCAGAPAHRENTISGSLAGFLDGRVRVALTVSGRDKTSGHGASVSALGGLAASALSALSALRHAYHLLSCELKRPQMGAGRMVRTSMGICVHPAVEEDMVGGDAA